VGSRGSRWVGSWAARWSRFFRGDFPGQNTFANSRARSRRCAASRRRLRDPIEAGMSIGTVLSSTELFPDGSRSWFSFRRVSPVLHRLRGRRESLGAAALRIAAASSPRSRHRGSDLMKIVFNIKEDDARNPAVIADLHRRQRGRLGRPDRRRVRRPTASPASR